MKTKLFQTCFFTLVFQALLGCQTGGDKEEKTLASTHPKLEEQLQTDSVSTPISSDQNPELYQRYRLNMEEAEAENNYSVPDMYTGKMAPVDLSTHAEAQQFEAALKEALKGGINFAGKYSVLTVGCGTACQQHFIVDRENGQVIQNIKSSAGARFSPDSRLFVVNPPDSTINYKECQYCAPETYVLENNMLLKLNLPN